jgi:hypothetical protein
MVTMLCDKVINRLPAFSSVTYESVHCALDQGIGENPGSVNQDVGAPSKL